MKTFALSVSLVLVFSLGYMVGKGTNFGMAFPKNTERKTASAFKPNSPVTPQPSGRPIIPAEWHEYYQDKAKLLAQDPKLADQYRLLVQEQTALQDSLDAAMVKAHPSVSSAITKLKALRSSRNSSNLPVSGNSTSQGVVMLTPKDWQEIRTARQLALKSHPELTTKAQELALKLQTFQKAVNAAILHNDPSINTLVVRADVRPRELKANTPNQSSNQ